MDDLISFAKESFRGFKETYRGQINEAKKEKLALNGQNNRRTGRRKEVGHFALRLSGALTRHQKVSRRSKAVSTYIGLHDCDPSPLLIESHMSDDASGPDEEEGESREVWKRRMAQEKNFRPGIDIEQLKFLETVKPEWRSEKVSLLLPRELALKWHTVTQLGAIFHDLHDIWWNSLKSRQKEKHQAWIVNTTGRSSSAPPIDAPYDFGINREWWTTAQEKYSDVLGDWYTYGNPEGFDDDEVEENEQADGNVEGENGDGNDPN
jgi:hypothetical protein